MDIDIGAIVEALENEHPRDGRCSKWAVIAMCVVVPLLLIASISLGIYYASVEAADILSTVAVANTTETDQLTTRYVMKQLDGLDNPTTAATPLVTGLLSSCTGTESLSDVQLAFDHEWAGNDSSRVVVGDNYVSGCRYYTFMQAEYKDMASYFCRVSNATLLAVRSAFEACRIVRRVETLRQAQTELVDQRVKYPHRVWVDCQDEAVCARFLCDDWAPASLNGHLLALDFSSTGACFKWVLLTEMLPYVCRKCLH